MSENRGIALKIAINMMFVGSISVKEYEDMSINQLEENALVWQPFEHWTMDDVCFEVESLAETIESALNEKEQEPKKKKFRFWQRKNKRD